MEQLLVQLIESGVGVVGNTGQLLNLEPHTILTMSAIESMRFRIQQVTGALMGESDIAPEAIQRWRKTQAGSLKDLKKKSKWKLVESRKRKKERQPSIW